MKQGKGVTKSLEKGSVAGMRGRKKGARDLILYLKPHRKAKRKENKGDRLSPKGKKGPRWGEKQLKIRENNK